MKLPISAIILTYNEEQNLENCLKSIADWVHEIIIVDSFSTDRTLDIAKKYGSRIYQHPFENQAKQFNWALDNFDIHNEWIFRLDADERVTIELWHEIAEILPRTAPETAGFSIKRRVYFMGRWIKHGGRYPSWLLRLFRKGKARSEERKMDEHIVLLEGKSATLKNDFIDDNQKDLEFWISKHNSYSSREVEEIVTNGNGGGSAGNRLARLPNVQAKRNRWLNENFYRHFPLSLRAFLYFFYRYFLRLGFLDGREGLIFHFLQGCWYRFLVDAKIYERTKKHKLEK